MKIAQILEMEVGQIGLACEGYVTYCKPPKNVAGIAAKTGKPYNFWSQFIIVKDDTGTIAVDINIDANRGVSNNEYVRIVKGVLEKNGDKFILKKAKLAEPLAAGPSPAMKQEVEPVFDEVGKLIQMPSIQKAIPVYQASETDKQKARGVALSYCLDVNKLNRAFKTSEEKEGIYNEALEITQFILTGKNPYKQESQS
jgi:hypothetical protein